MEESNKKSRRAGRMIVRLNGTVMGDEDLCREAGCRITDGSVCADLSFLRGVSSVIKYFDNFLS